MNVQWWAAGKSVLRGGVMWLLWAGCVWAGCVWAGRVDAQDIADEVFSPYDVQVGKSINKQQCAGIAYAVWVEHKYGSECIRYFPSPDAEGAKLAAFFIHGDHRDGKMVIGYANKSFKSQMAQMALNARYNKVPFILIGRPGTYGSSGDHGARRRPKEFYTLNAAVDAIKVKLGIEQIILAGQSGGATSVAALLTLGRTDVRCAVATSGSYDILALADIKREKMGSRRNHGVDVTGYADPYNVIDFVSGIARDPERRIFIIGDPTDNNTVFPLQKAFAEKVAAAGHKVELVEAKGLGPDRHSLSHVGFKAAGWCAAGLPSDVIRRKIETNAAALGVVQKRVEKIAPVEVEVVE